MARYKTKPCEIEAIQWNGLNLEEIKAFVGESLIYDICDTAWEVGKGRPHVLMKIKTLEGDMQTSEGDYIIKGLRGEFYPCKPDVFEKKYELSEQTDNDNQKGMTEEEKNILSDSLDKLSSEKCEIEIGISSTCSIDCPFFINGAYGVECAIGIVSYNLN